MGQQLCGANSSAFAKELELAEGMEFDVSRVDDGLLLSPRKRSYTLKELLEKITPENVHGETDWGPPVGREAW